MSKWGSNWYSLNSQLLRSFAPSAIAQNGFIEVDSSLHVVPKDVEEREKLGGRVFAIGDIANSDESLTSKSHLPTKTEADA